MEKNVDYLNMYDADNSKYVNNYKSFLIKLLRTNKNFDGDFNLYDGSVFSSSKLSEIVKTLDKSECKFIIDCFGLEDGKAKSSGELGFTGGTVSTYKCKIFKKLNELDLSKICLNKKFLASNSLCIADFKNNSSLFYDLVSEDIASEKQDFDIDSIISENDLLLNDVSTKKEKLLLLRKKLERLEQFNHLKKGIDSSVSEFNESFSKLPYCLK